MYRLQPDDGVINEVEMIRSYWRVLLRGNASHYSPRDNIARMTPRQRPAAAAAAASDVTKQV